MGGFRFERFLGRSPIRFGPLLMLFLRFPFNGQRKRKELFTELLRLPFDAIVETGTFIGSSTAFFGRACGAGVYGVEKNPVCSWFARLRLKRLAGVRVVTGDSREFLKSLRQSASFPKKNVLFYLDAHGGSDVPLPEEVAIITGSWSEFVIVIDDFEVPGDPGYHFDDYGSAGVFSLRCFDFRKIAHVALFSPSAPASSETGFRRGCIVLVSRDSMLPKIAKVRALHGT